MRKHILNAHPPSPSEIRTDWLPLDQLASVEVTSEEVSHPIENALLPGAETGWRAARSGEQMIRLIFDSPQSLQHIRLVFIEHEVERSGDGLLWAFSRIEPIFHDQLPPFPDYMGTWTPARHVWHVTDYERADVMPAMRLWLGDALPEDEDEHDDEAAWAAVTDRSYEALAAGFRAVRQEQIALLQALAVVNWAEERQTDWRMKPLSMVVTKTFQHTYEHGDTLLRMELWWHGFPER